MSKFFTDEPRDDADFRIECHADPELFLDWDDLSKEAKKEFEKNGTIPCEGGGVIGLFCDGCRFYKIIEL